MVRYAAMKLRAAICAMILMCGGQQVLVCRAAEPVEPLAVADKPAKMRLSASVLKKQPAARLARGCPRWPAISIYALRRSMRLN